jgi:hypothetical protein
MYDPVRIRRRINLINWAFALILSAECVSDLWLLLGGWPLKGWLRDVFGRSPYMVSTAVALAFAGLLFYHRPLRLESWALPDGWTVLYGLALALFCGLGVVVLASFHIFGG